MTRCLPRQSPLASSLRRPEGFGRLAPRSFHHRKSNFFPSFFQRVHYSIVWKYFFPSRYFFTEILEHSLVQPVPRPHPQAGP